MTDKLKIFFSTPVEKIAEKHSSLLAGACFLILATSNALLSFGNLSVLSKIWTSLFGIIAPSAFLFARLKNQDLFRKEIFRFIPLWVWVMVMASALFLRLYHVIILSPWPFSDEGLFGYFATLLEEKWNWQLLHCPAQEPILYSWGLFLFFKLFGHSLATFWLFPALCSLAFVPALWLACRKTLPRSTTFFMVCWTALSFWPLYLGWFSLQQILMVLWECLTFAALAEYITSTDKPENNRWFYALAVSTGTGFYTYLAWPLIALLVTITLAANPNQPFFRRLKWILRFLTIVFVLVLPILIVYAVEYRGYFHHLWAFGTPHDFMDRLLLPMTSLSDFFWGAPQKFFHYGPIWGGFLNPLLTSLFFWGLVYLFRNRRKPFSLWIFTALLIFLLPTVLTNNFEVMRLTPILPLLLLICAIGTQSFLSIVPINKRIPVFLALLLASTAIDLYHLFYVYPRDVEKNVSYYAGARSPEFSKAYFLLKSIAEREGPGLILLNFVPDPYDQTFFVATYSFNAAENLKLNPSEAKWAAVLANIHEEPYFKKVFPEGNWVWLSEGLKRQDGGLILEIIPVAQNNKTLLSRWTKADQSLKKLTNLVMELGVDPDQGQMLGVLDKAYPFFKGDPLLESRYWRIMAFHHAAEGKTLEAIADEKKAVEKGLPMAHLYNDMGCLLFKGKKSDEAKKAFKAAVRLKLNLTDASTNLQNLLLIEQKTK